MQIKISNANNAGAMLTINGGWSPWSTVATPCIREINGAMVDVSCGGGKMIRRRSCTNPEPQVKRHHTQIGYIYAYTYIHIYIYIY